MDLTVRVLKHSHGKWESAQQVRAADESILTASINLGTPDIKTVFRLLGGSWVVISRAISPVIRLIAIVTLLITPLITTHEPPSSETPVSMGGGTFP